MFACACRGAGGERSPASGPTDVCVGGRGGGSRRRHGGFGGGVSVPSSPPGPVVRPRRAPAPRRRGRAGFPSPPPPRAAPRHRARPRSLSPAFPLGRLEGRGPDAGPPLLVRPPPAVQVPSAFRRGGLKTPWGIARPPAGRGRWWARGGVPSGGARPLPRLPRGLRPPAGAAPPPPVPRSRRPSGGGFTRRPSRARAARVACAPRRGGGNPPGACGVVSALAPAWAARASPWCETFRPLSGVRSRFCCLSGRPEATPSPLGGGRAAPGGPPGVFVGSALAKSTSYDS